MNATLSEFFFSTTINAGTSGSLNGSRATLSTWPTTSGRHSSFWARIPTTQSFWIMTYIPSTTTPSTGMMNAPATQSLPGWRQTRICNAPRPYSFTRGMPMAPCVWWKKCGARVAALSMFLSPSWRKESGTTGKDRRNKGRVQRGKEGKTTPVTHFPCYPTFPFSVCFLVARDGIEPPTPAFSGPLTESPKWFENQRMSLRENGICVADLGCL